MKEEYISDFTLERYLLKELPDKQIMEIDNLCIQKPDLKERIELIKKEDAEILSKYREHEIVAEINRRYNIQTQDNKKHKAVSRSVQKRFLLPSILIATAALAVFIILPAIRTTFYNITTDHYPGDILTKGFNSIFVHRKINNTTELLQNGSTAKAGDLLQIEYTSIKDQYGIILSIDGRGTVTLHYPDPSGSTKLTTGKKVLLNHSYELDDAPDFEKFYFITSDSELNVNSILHAAELLAGKKKDIVDEEKGKIEIADSNISINQVSFLIRKIK